LTNDFKFLEYVDDNGTRPSEFCLQNRKEEDGSVAATNEEGVGVLAHLKTTSTKAEGSGKGDEAGDMEATKIWIMGRNMGNPTGKEEDGDRQDLTQRKKMQNIISVIDELKETARRESSSEDNMEGSWRSRVRYLYQMMRTPSGERDIGDSERGKPKYDKEKIKDLKVTTSLWMSMVNPMDTV